MTKNDTYCLDDQIGFLLRKANQRHTGIFATQMPEGLTPTRFAVLAKLMEAGEVSQNELGRLTAMDSATIKGVVDRLKERDLVQTHKAKDDGRMQIVSLTEKGRNVANQTTPIGEAISQETLNDLSADERKTLLNLLKRIT